MIVEEFSQQCTDIEDYPCSDALQCYKVRLDGERVFVSAEETAFKSQKRPFVTAKKPTSDKTFLIIGGGMNIVKLMSQLLTTR
jgi:hypothetical protein